MSKKFIKPAIYFLVVALITFIIYVSFPRNSVSVSDQPKGAAVKIKGAELARGGFIQVSIHPQELLNPGVELGVSEYLPVGKYRNFNIFLDKEEAMGIYSKIVTTVYLDNGDGAFDQGSDHVTARKTAEVY